MSHRSLDPRQERMSVVIDNTEVVFQGAPTVMQRCQVLKVALGRQTIETDEDCQVKGCIVQPHEITADGIVNALSNGCLAAKDQLPINY